MVSLIMLIAAGLLTSSTAVSYVPQSFPGASRCKSLRYNPVLQTCIGILALSLVHLALHFQLGGFR